MKGFGEAWPCSVFRRTRQPIDGVRIENVLCEILNLRQDHVLILDLGADEQTARESSTFMWPGIPEAESGWWWFDRIPEDARVR